MMNATDAGYHYDSFSCKLESKYHPFIFEGSFMKPKMFE